MANTISILIQVAKDKAVRDVHEFSVALDNGTKSSGKFGNALESMGGHLVRATAVLSAAALAAGTAGAAIGLKFNSSVEQAEAKLMAFTKDGVQVAKTLAWVKQEAAETQFSFTDMANAAAQLTPVARTSGKSLQDLVRQAEILAALNPTEGLTGAVFSLREALSGDWVSIMDRFNLPRTRINELKAQGVPAMEIISRTLQEMGIDYSLVAAQGKTAAAQFDQIKDKLTMLAGRATKPLFDRIKQGLSGINEMNFDKVGAGLEAGMSRALDVVQNVQGAIRLLATGDYQKGLFAAGIAEDSKVVDVVLKIREAFVKAWEFIKPAVQELGRVFRETLLPALQELWKQIQPSVIPVLKMLAVVIGGALLGALWLLIKALTIAVEIVAFFYRTVAGGVQIIKDATKNVTLFVFDVINGVKQMQMVVASIPAAFQLAWSQVANATALGAQQVINWFTKLPERIVFGIGYAAGWLKSFVTIDIPNFVNSAVLWFEQLPTRIAGAMTLVYTSVVGWFARTRSDTETNVSNTVNSAVAWFESMPGRIGAAVASLWGNVVGGFNSFKDNLISWASSVVSIIVSEFKSIPARIAAAVGQAANDVKNNLGNFFGDLGKTVQAGLAAGQKRSIGTNFAMGGPTLVGEHGAEVINLPAGATVDPAWKSRGGASGGDVINQYFSGTYQFSDQRDMEAFFEMASTQQRRARLGIAS